MKEASAKHLYVVGGWCRFALATVRRLADEELHSGKLDEPKFILNDFSVQCGPEEKRIIEEARAGIQEAETDLEWSGNPHVLVSLQGLVVDGIDPLSARLAAAKATKSLIRDD